jgi:hypothetical protein
LYSDRSFGYSYPGLDSSLWVMICGDVDAANIIKNHDVNTAALDLSGLT